MQSIPFTFLRKVKDISQRKLSKLANVSFRTIQLLEANAIDVKLSTIFKLADGLGIDKESLRDIISEYFQQCPDNIQMTSRLIDRYGDLSWKIHLFNFVDAFRKHPLLPMIEGPLTQLASPEIKALLASTVEVLAREQGLPAPWWCRAVLPLKEPWFVSEIENLKAMALIESPVDYRKRNIFVLNTFLQRA